MRSMVAFIDSEGANGEREDPGVPRQRINKETHTDIPVKPHEHKR